ncbi:MAG: GNAT family N-acetyltransferase [Candidatus Nanohaloarchaea archaeon]
MIIRGYNSEDQEHVEKLIRDSLSGIEEKYNEEELRHLESVITEMVAGFAEEEKFRFFVVEDENNLLGCAGLNIENGRVAGIFVNPANQGVGVGSRLMKKLEGKAREKDLEKLEATASISAGDFYRKLGFDLVEKDKSEIEGKEISVNRMEKRL